MLKNKNVVKCDICNKPIDPLFCTIDVCPGCCEEGKCPIEKAGCAYKKALSSLGWRK